LDLITFSGAQALGRTALDEGSARRRDLHLATHNTRNKHPCPGGIWEFEPIASASEWPQTHTLNGAATGTCTYTYTYIHTYIYIYIYNRPTVTVDINP